MLLDTAFVRSQFPALDGEWIFLDNAGGSQILAPVLRRLQEYLIRFNVQHGASYLPSRRAAAALDEANHAVARWLGAPDAAEVVLGPSSTMLLRILAACLGRTFAPGDEVIVTDSDHEANIGPWLQLAERGIVVRTWHVDRESCRLELSALRELLSARTRLVALTHVSNVLGTINPVAEIARVVHEHGALVCVDGVAFAPHRRVDVQALDVDFYVLSFYKVFGPHHAVLYGRRQHLVAMPGFNHFFVDPTDIPYKFQPGNVNYELSYSLMGLWDYVTDFCAAHEHGDLAANPRRQLEFVFDRVGEHEEALTAQLLEFLSHKARVRIVGSPGAERTERVPTVSFVVDGKTSDSIVQATDARHVGIRFGHFYSKRLIDALGLAARNGVVRVSMAHYNTRDEMTRLTQALDAVL